MARLSLRVERGRRIAWYPLLFAAYPVLFLWSQNVGETSRSDVLPLLVLSVAIAAVVMAILTVLLGDARRAALIVTPVILGLLMYGHVENLVHPFRVRPAMQQLGWVAFVGLGILGAWRLGEGRLAQLTRILNGVAGVLVLVAVVVIVPSQLNTDGASAGRPARAGVSTAVRPDRPLRDVYYIVLDRYGSDRALDLRFGARNDLTGWLTDKGFRVLPDTRANYVKTTMSMASTLNMTHLDELAATMGPDSSDHGPIFDMLQNTRVGEQFQALGYDYLHIGSYYSPTRTDTGADRNLFEGGPSDFGAALYDNSAMPALLRRLRIVRGVNPSYDRHHRAALFEFNALRTMREVPGPKFVLAHLLLPHPPYSFAADGSFQDDVDVKKLPENEAFADQLHWTNEQLKAWLEPLLALPEDQQPIIILQADEGPYPTAYNRNTAVYDWSTASLEELQEKYGILNAWYVPGGTDIGLDDLKTSVNTFPTLFSGYFGLDTPRLPDRSYTSKGKTLPYDLTDVTDRLDAYQP